MRTKTELVILLIILIMMLTSLNGCSNRKRPLESDNSDRVTASEHKQADVPGDAMQTPTDADVESTEAPTQHVHNFTDATCLEPKKCTDCGATQGDPLGHDYSVVEEDGTKSCSRCGQIDPESKPVGLHEIILVDSKKYEYSNEILTDSFGYTYTGAHVFGNWEKADATAVFNIDHRFSVFQGSIVAGTQTPSDREFYVRVYVDDGIVYSSPAITKVTGKLNFCIPVTNGQLLRIEMWSDASWGGNIYIVDAYLVK